jgi:hypothetical protein
LIGRREGGKGPRRWGAALAFFVGLRTAVVSSSIWERGMLEVVREEAQEEEAKAGEEAQEAEAAVVVEA